MKTTIPAGKERGSQRKHNLSGKDNMSSLASLQANFFDDDSEEQVNLLPSPPPVPLKAFPSRVAALLQEASQAFVVPSQVPTAALLGLLAGLVGRSRAIQIKRGWNEHGNLWLALVANSGLGKTPVYSAFFDPLKKAESRLFRKWEKEMVKFREEERIWRKSKDEDRSEYPPTPPLLKQYSVDDATLEAVGTVLSTTPKGVIWRVDELSGMMASFDRYQAGGKEGGTRARLLSAYDCQEWKTTRRDGSKKMNIPAACVSIFGGIQPGMLNRSFSSSDKDAGMLNRFIFIRAERAIPASWNDASLSPKSEELLRQIVDRLLEFDVTTDADGETCPKVVTVTDQARELFKFWHDQIATEAWLSGEMEAVLTKLKSQALRLCLLLHCLDAALTGTDGTSPIQADTMRRALLLADWIKEHQFQAWRLLDSSDNARQCTPVERAVMSALVENEEEVIKKNGRLCNARLGELVNARLPMAVKPEVIGKACSALELPPIWVGDRKSRERGRLITAKKIEFLKKAIGIITEPPSKDCPDNCPDELLEELVSQQPQQVPLAAPVIPTVQTVGNQFSAPENRSEVRVIGAPDSNRSMYPPKQDGGKNACHQEWKERDPNTFPQ